MHDAMVDRVLDARDLPCPKPVIRARLELNRMKPGQVLKVIAGEQGSVRDFQGWAQVSKTIKLMAQGIEKVNGQQLYVHLVQKVS